MPLPWIDQGEIVPLPWTDQGEARSWTCQHRNTGAREGEACVFLTGMRPTILCHILQRFGSNLSRLLKLPIRNPWAGSPCAARCLERAKPPACRKVRVNSCILATGRQYTIPSNHLCRLLDFIRKRILILVPRYEVAVGNQNHSCSFTQNLSEKQQHFGCRRNRTHVASPS